MSPLHSLRYMLGTNRHKRVKASMLAAAALRTPSLVRSAVRIDGCIDFVDELEVSSSPSAYLILRVR